MTPRKSEINCDFEVTESTWVISLVRIKKTLPSQHVFLILETIENNEHKTYFMDFVGESWVSEVLKDSTNNECGRVRFWSSDRINDQDYTRRLSEGHKLIFSCNSRLMDIRNGDRIYYDPHFINKSVAEKLLRQISHLADKTKKPGDTRLPFNILGGESIISEHSAMKSNKEQGDNCFTWAKKQLKTVDIEIKANSIVEWLNKVAAITSFTVSQSQKKSSWSSCLWATFFVGVATIAGFNSEVFADTPSNSP